MYDSREKSSYFQDLIDDAKNRAIARGSDTVEWNDVWAATAKNLKTSGVLSDRNVSTSSLYTEIDFITRFRDSAEASESHDQLTKVQAAVDEIVRDISEYRRVVERHEHGDRVEAIKDIAKFFEDRMRRKHISADTDEAKEEASLKTQVVGKALEDSMRPIVNQMMGGIPGAEELGGFVDLKDEISKIVLQELVSRPWVLGESQDIVNSLEKLNTNPMQLPSPVEVVDHIIEQSGSFYTELLYRNGLRSSDPDRQDTLESVFPRYQVQRTALRALDTANTLNSKQLNKRHFALALLGNPEVRVHLTKLGVPDLIKFEEDFRTNSLDMDDKPEGKVSIHTQIPEEMDELIDSLDQAYKDKPTAPEMMLWLMKNDKDIDRAMNKSGLTRQMLSKWRLKYDVKLEEDEEVKKGPQVSDEELERLIKEYCVDVTALAANRKIDPMIGNEDVLDQVTTKLTKRGKKNPIIIGEAGIGKTKVFEGLAYAMLRGNAPEELIGGRLLTLDLQKMNSPWRGEFEGKIIKIMQGLSERNAMPNATKTILGIDEIAVAQNAGTHSGDPNGFRGLAKPYLASGDLLMMATTTEDEYRQQVEKDPAWARRTQPVHMKEPSTDETTEILLKLKRLFSRHHKLRIPNKLVPEIAALTGRYMHTVNQPDKSIDTLDEACALARKEGAVTLRKEHILKVVSDKTNIPSSFLSQNDNQRYADIEKRVGKRVIGQDEAVKLVSSSLKRAKAGFKDPDKPVGNYLFVGPTGVGKTELAKALAEFLMGNEEEFLVRFDMSEYQEKSSVSRLTGSDPGLVGYDEGGSLIRSARSKPYAVYLYDEGDKAHPDVFNLLLGAFDNGIVTDGRGITGNLRNAINIITTNLGAREVMEMGYGRGLDPINDYEAWQEMADPIYKKAVEDFFRPEFLNRLDGVIYFNSLSPDVLKQLVKRSFKKTASQLKEGHGLELKVSQPFLTAAVEKGFDVRYGARPLKRVWAEMVETPMSDWLLRQNQRDLKKATTLRMATARTNGFAVVANDVANDEGLDQADLTAATPIAANVASLDTRRVQNTEPVFELLG